MARQWQEGCGCAGPRCLLWVPPGYPLLFMGWEGNESPSDPSAPTHAPFCLPTLTKRTLYLCLNCFITLFTKHTAFHSHTRTGRRVPGKLHRATAQHRMATLGLPCTGTALLAPRPR